MAIASMPFVPEKIARTNRHYARKLGWKVRYYQVKAILGLESTLPDPVQFASAVWAWQDRTPGLVADGMLGPKTWKRMKPLTRFDVPMSPLPAWMRMNTAGSVKYHVPMVLQGANPICWVACVSMMYAYRNRRPFDIRAFTGGWDPTTSSVPAGSSAIRIQGLSQIVQFMRGLGFQPILYRTHWFGEDDLLQSLVQFGPLVAFLDAARLFVHYEAESGHAVVITGLNAATDTCYINNPWGQEDERRDVNLVLDALDKWKEKPGVGAQGANLMSLA
ncbi:MAG: papain-like cysteine protease family protein [Gemmatimonadota bacterium]|jgi:hypothetical protein